VASLGTINDSLIDVIELGLPYPAAVDDHEPIRMRAIFNERTRY
jgi:tryptophan synthase alpha subunit